MNRFLVPTLLALVVAAASLIASGSTIAAHVDEAAEASARLDYTVGYTKATYYKPYGYNLAGGQGAAG
ncbi:MAG: hypothetical protein NVS9B2_20900 [Steroidobacteraceae bacterium]